MNITFHECRYILHLKDYDSGVFFYREVLGLQPNYNWSIVPDQKGYRFYMGSGRLEITQIPFTPRQGHSEFLAQCSDHVLLYFDFCSGFWRKCPTSRSSLRMPGR